jgi:hypothetical protein
MKKFVIVWVVIVLGFASFAISGPPVGAARRPPGPTRVDGTEAVRKLLGQPAAPRAAASARREKGLPTWSGSFSLGGKTYPYTMLGSDPAAGSKTTNLRVKILPLRLTFDDGGATLDGTDTIKDILHSPIFKRATYRSGHTQYGEAMQRAEFADLVATKSPVYHVMLSKPRVLPTVSLQIPASGGFSFDTASGPGGFVSNSFLISLFPRLEPYIDPTAVIVLILKDVQGEGFLGFHTSFLAGGHTAQQTLIWTGYFTPGVVVPARLADAYVLSHEVTEWINDPFVNNIVPVWINPGDGSCFSNILETGDPVEFLPRSSFEVRTDGRTYHMTDMAGISWFAHDVPSRMLGGAYSYDGNLTTFSELC